MPNNITLRSDIPCPTKKPRGPKNKYEIEKLDIGQSLLVQVVDEEQEKKVRFALYYAARQKKKSLNRIFLVAPYTDPTEPAKKYVGIWRTA